MLWKKAGVKYIHSHTSVALANTFFLSFFFHMKSVLWQAKRSILNHIINRPFD